MFSDRVAQNPTMPVRAGKKKAQNWPLLAWPGSKAEGWESIGPNPPAPREAPARSRRPRAMRRDALRFSSQRMASMPLYTTSMLIPQKKRKQRNWGKVMPKAWEAVAEASDGKNTDMILKMALPPIQVWMPNQPHATSARSSAGTLAP